MVWWVSLIAPLKSGVRIGWSAAALLYPVNTLMGPGGSPGGLFFETSGVVACSAVSFRFLAVSLIFSRRSSAMPPHAELLPCKLRLLTFFIRLSMKLWSIWPLTLSSNSGLLC